jgi:hypothetical protein
MKRELWGVVSAIKSDQGYIIGLELVIETDCLPIFGMRSGCNTRDIFMLRCIMDMKSLKPEI